MKPVLLLVPGMLNDERVWAPVAERVSHVFDTHTACVTRQTSLQDMARDALALVAGITPSRPVVLAGFSMGGYVAMELLVAYPHRWRAALLVATSCLPDTPAAAQGRDQAMAAFETDFEGTIQGIARRGFGPAGSAAKDVLLDMMRGVGPETAVRQMRAIRDRADHRVALADLSLPVRVLCGDSDRVTPPALSEALANAIPTATLQWVPGAGHMVPIEQPDAVAQALLDRWATQPL
jgi:pimeloyl-ACP methyl ester carboxylesterase